MWRRRDSPAELAGARIARALGRTVAAVPGRVTSPASSGTHALLMDGAQLVRDAADVLALLQGGVEPRRRRRGARPASLEPRLRHTLESVGGGRDTPDKLAAAGTDAGEVLLRLSELELMGLLARGDGGRYVLAGCASVITACLEDVHVWLCRFGALAEAWGCGVRCSREVVDGGGMTRNLAGVRAFAEICLPPLVHGCRRDFIEA